MSSPPPPAEVAPEGPPPPSPRPTLLSPPPSPGFFRREAAIARLKAASLSIHKDMKLCVCVSSFFFFFFFGAFELLTSYLFIYDMRPLTHLVIFLCFDVFLCQPPSWESSIRSGDSLYGGRESEGGVVLPGIGNGYTATQVLGCGAGLFIAAPARTDADTPAAATEPRGAGVRIKGTCCRVSCSCEDEVWDSYEELKRPKTSVAAAAFNDISSSCSTVELMQYNHDP